MKFSALAVSLMLAFGTASAAPDLTPMKGKPFTWENATVYFLLTDRFNNGNPANDHAYGHIYGIALYNEALEFPDEVFHVIYLIMDYNG